MIGEECEVDEDCNDFDTDSGGVCTPPRCGDTGDGVCGASSDAVLGNVLNVNGATALLAVAQGFSIIPQPSYRKDKRLNIDFEYQLVDRGDLVQIDPEYCKLPFQVQAPITPTAGMLQNGTGGGP